MPLARLIILGAGGTSREIAGAVRDINGKRPQWDLVGYLDDNPALHGSKIDGVAVLGPIEADQCADAWIVIGVARAKNRALRREIVERLALPRERYATIIHPSASVSAYATTGAGTAILQNVVITPGTSVGDHVLILQNVSMAHDQVVEDFVTIAPGATVAGGARLKRGSYIGAGSAILDGVIVHEGALVGIGAVVMQDVPEGVTVAGNPARALPQSPRDRV